MYLFGERARLGLRHAVLAREHLDVVVQRREVDRLASKLRVFRKTGDVLLGRQDDVRQRLKATAILLRHCRALGGRQILEFGVDLVDLVLQVRLSRLGRTRHRRRKRRAFSLKPLAFALRRRRRRTVTHEVVALCKFVVRRLELFRLALQDVDEFLSLGNSRRRRVGNVVQRNRHRAEGHRTKSNPTGRPDQLRENASQSAEAARTRRRTGRCADAPQSCDKFVPGDKHLQSSPRRPKRHDGRRQIDQRCRQRRHRPDNPVDACDERRRVREVAQRVGQVTHRAFGRVEGVDRVGLERVQRLLEPTLGRHFELRRNVVHEPVRVRDFGFQIVPRLANRREHLDRFLFSALAKKFAEDVGLRRLREIGKFRLEVGDDGRCVTQVAVRLLGFDAEFLERLGGFSRRRVQILEHVPVRRTRRRPGDVDLGEQGDGRGRVFDRRTVLVMHDRRGLHRLRHAVDARLRQRRRLGEHVTDMRQVVQALAEGVHHADQRERRLFHAHLAHRREIHHGRQRLQGLLRVKARLRQHAQAVGQFAWAVHAALRERERCAADLRDRLRRLAAERLDERQLIRELRTRRRRGLEPARKRRTRHQRHQRPVGHPERAEGTAQAARKGVALVGGSVPHLLRVRRCLDLGFQFLVRVGQRIDLCLCGGDAAETCCLK